IYLAISFIKQEDSSWKISLYLLKMLNKLGGIIFDRFGESLKLLKKIIKQMQMIEELQEGEAEGYVCSQKRFILIDSTALHLHRLLSTINHCGLGKISLDNFNEIDGKWRLTLIK